MEPENKMAEGDLNDLGSLNTMAELRELVEFLKASGVTQFDLERPEMKVKLKFERPEPAATPAVSALDLATMAKLMSGGPAPLAQPTASAREEESGAVPASAGAVTSASGAAEMVIAAEEDSDLHVVHSPLVGTFYDAASPGAESFVKVGDRVAAGKVLCIVEAMKIMNEIESDAAGEVVKVFVKPGQPVEYGQQLFALRN